MNRKVIIYGEDATKKLAAGADKLARAVVSTFGPRSKNVAINREYPAPKVLHDGVSVAREVRLEDDFEDMGATLLREAASKTNDLAGDGTTTATLLANTLIQSGFKITRGGISEGVIHGKVNAMEMQKQLLEYSQDIVDKLDKMAKKVKTDEDRRNVATISAASPEIGALVADAVKAVGNDGLVMVEPGTNIQNQLEIKEGMEFDNGYLSQFFVTDPDKDMVLYDRSYILLTDYKISDGMDLVPIIEKVVKDGQTPLLILADDVVGAALNTLVLSKMKAKYPLVAVVAPEFADRRRQMLDDLAILTGGRVISKELNMKLTDVTLADLGRASSLKITSTTTTIVPENPDAEEINERVALIQEQIDAEENDFKKQRLQDRLGKLSQKVAVLKVGGATEQEIGEKKERVIDAVSAIKAALAEGIIPGGGMTLYQIGAELESRGDEMIYKVVQEALMAPFETLLKNSGEESDKVKAIIDALPDEVKNRGYDVVGKKAGDLLQLGVIDPVKVTKLAVRHAFSVAGVMLTTETLIADAKDDVQKVRPVQ